MIEKVCDLFAEYRINIWLVQSNGYFGSALLVRAGDRRVDDVIDRYGIRLHEAVVLAPS